jgi:putative hydrolase of the HAD superfamily
MIKQIWFDFGNIFIPIYPSATTEAFEKCGVRMKEDAFSALALEFEKGEISERQFFQELTASCKFLQSSRCIQNAWNALLGELHDNTLFLKKLNQQYDLCLVSNTNDAHIKAIQKASGPFLWNTFIEQFDALFLSFEMGCRKPDSEYFNRVLQSMNAQPDEVLFIDDTESNIEAAAALGLHTWQFNIQEGNLEHDLPAILAKLNKRTASATGV